MNKTERMKINIQTLYFLLVVFVVIIFSSWTIFFPLLKSRKYSILSTKNYSMEKNFLNRCKYTSKFKAFVYPNRMGHKPFKNLLYGKEYFTEDPYQACVFVYFLEKDAISLRKLKYWGKNGENHLIMNLDNHNLEVFGDTGFALISQPTFLPGKFRPGYDFLLPFYNETASNRIWESLAPIFPLQRKWILSYMESYDIRLKESSVYIQKLCMLMETWNKQATELQGKLFVHCLDNLSNRKLETKEDQWRIFADSVFTVIIVPPNAEESLIFQRLLLAALQNGAIPVLISNGNKEEILPLKEYVAWDKMVIWMSAANVNDILWRIQLFSGADIKQMKQDGRYAAEVLLSRKGSILACILETIRERLLLPGIGFQQTPSKKLFIRNPKGLINDTDYNQPSAYKYGEEYLAKIAIPSKALTFTSPLLGVGKSWPEEKFTIVMPTYHREKILKQVLTQYKDLPFLDRIVLVWNAQDVKVNENTIPDIGVPIYVISNGINSLNNRFLPFDVIRTQAVFTVDDDIRLQNGDILHAFRVWRENRDRIIGFPVRYHAWNAKRKTWDYRGDFGLGISVILTQATFLHKHYLFLYSYAMNPVIRKIVFDKKNCEDIAMNMLIAYVSKKPPLKVTHQKPFDNTFPIKKGIHTEPGHTRKRDECMDGFAKIYGYMPLLFTQYENNYLMKAKEYTARFKHDI